jgi:hypothetical protein
MDPRGEERGICGENVTVAEAAAPLTVIALA